MRLLLEGLDADAILAATVSDHPEVVAVHPLAARARTRWQRRRPLAGRRGRWPMGKLRRACRPIITDEKLKHTRAMVSTDLTVREIATRLRVSKTALYEALGVEPSRPPELRFPSNHANRRLGTRLLMLVANSMFEGCSSLTPRD